MPPLSRRQVLSAALATVAAAAGAAAAGCRAEEDRPAPSRSAASTEPAAPRPPDPLVALVATERQLLDGYDRTAGAHPGLAGRLAPVRADHVQHLAALDRVLAAGTASPATGGSPTPSPEAAPTPAAALAALRAAERAAATALAGIAETAPADRAALLASIAACEASHQVLLS